MQFEKSINLTSVANARELGGYVTTDGRRVKSGVLLRTANLADINAEDAAKLENVYKVGYVIDFRFETELKGFKDKEINGAKHVNIDVLQLPDSEMKKDYKKVMSDPVVAYYETKRLGLIDERLYINIAESDKGAAGYGKFFDVLLSADEGRAVLFHCTCGKDRTGIAAMLILGALGVDNRTILKDYTLTNEYNAETAKRITEYVKSLTDDKEVIENFAVIKAVVREKFMQNLLEHVDKTYGGVVGYLKTRLSLTDEELDRLKEKYLET